MSSTNTQEPIYQPLCKVEQLLRDQVNDMKPELKKVYQHAVFCSKIKTDGAVQELIDVVNSWEPRDQSVRSLSIYEKVKVIDLLPTSVVEMKSLIDTLHSIPDRELETLVAEILRIRQTYVFS